MSYIGQKPADKLVTSSDMEDGIVTTAKIADSSVTTEKIVADTNFRNIIINGDMSIAQRSTSTSSASTQAYHCTDRWFNVGMTIGTWTISQSTDVPTGQGFAKSLKYDCTTAEASPGAGDQLHLSQRIEGQNLQYLKKGTANAESLTLSFWVKTNKTGTYQVNLRDKDNTRIIGQTYTVSLADTWEKKTITYAGDTTGALGNDNGDSLECEWFLGAGTNYTSGSVPTSWEAESATDRAAGLTVNLGDSTDNEWYITGVQLEAGTTASDFEFLPFDVNLTRCQRYFYQTGTNLNGAGQVTFGTGQWYSSSEIIYCIYAPTRMRVKPTLTSPTVTNGYRFHKAGSFTDVDTGGVMTDADNQILSIYKSGLGGGTGGQATFVVSQSSPAKLQFNAEL
jgi:hypothetical protein